MQLQGPHPHSEVPLPATQTSDVSLQVPSALAVGQLVVQEAGGAVIAQPADVQLPDVRQVSSGSLPQVHRPTADEHELPAAGTFAGQATLAAPPPPPLPPPAPAVPAVPPCPPAFDGPSTPASTEPPPPQAASASRPRMRIAEHHTRCDTVLAFRSRRLQAHGETADAGGRRAARAVAARPDRRTELTAKQPAAAFAARQVATGAGGLGPLAATPLDAQARRRRQAVCAAEDRRWHRVGPGQAHAAAARLGVEGAIVVGRAEAAARPAGTRRAACATRTGRAAAAGRRPRAAGARRAAAVAGPRRAARSRGARAACGAASVGGGAGVATAARERDQEQQPEAGMSSHR
jgi:hypothetical protein